MQQPANWGRQGTQVIASGAISDGQDRGSGLWLYSLGGARFDHALMRERLVSGAPDLLSHDFGAVEPIVRQVQVARPAFELVLGGLTFDAFLIDVSRGHLRQAYENGPLSDTEPDRAVVLVPGPHLAGTGGTVLTVRAQWHLGALLMGLLPEIAAAGWPPSATVLPAALFVSETSTWAKGGAPAVPGVLAFRPALGGALQSAGLAHFTGQELRLEPELAALGDAGERLAQRIAEMLIHRGALTVAEQFTGPSGESLRLEPSANGRFVRVWPG